jgi:hypothetical protein
MQNTSCKKTVLCFNDSLLTFKAGVRVRVTLRLTVSQPVSLGVEPLLGLMTRFLVLPSDYCCLCPLGGAPSLTRGRVCHLSVVFVMIFMSCQNIYISIYTLRYVQYVQGLCQSRLCEADYAEACLNVI